MANWKNNKGSGPWDFTEQSNKWGYLNNPRWSNRQDSIDFCKGLGLEAGSLSEHKPCGHWHKDKYFPMPVGKWVAAMQQPGTPYIYLYNIGIRAVIRVNTALTPPIVDGILRLNSTYTLDYDIGWGNPGAQRGGYCMNKDGTRIWYLFTESDGNRSDAELVEVNITSYYMKKVKSTIYPNLVPSEPFPSMVNERINDSCSDDIYTYWPTTLIAGRIIKIRNSDHSIIDDHYFNYPIEPCSGNSLDEAISTIDVDKSNEKLYWVYTRDHAFCVPAYNACRHLIRADTDLVSDIDDVTCASGAFTPAWQNMIRVYSDYILHHRAYYPSTVGYLIKRDLNFSLSNQITQEYLQNIFGVKDEKVFTLMHVNSVDHPAFLYCLDFSSMDEISKLDVSYYAGQRYPDPYDWDWTSVSAMNQQTGVIAIFRYHNEEERNYAGCFSANSGLEFLCDARFERIYDDPTLGPFGEPQSWPFEGFTPPEIPEAPSPIEVISDPGSGEVIYEPSYPPGDAPDQAPILQNGFSDHNISIGPGQILFFQFEASVPDCDHPIQITYTQKGIPRREGTGHCGAWDEGDWNYCRNCGPCREGQGGCLKSSECIGELICIDGVCQQQIKVHILVKRGSKPTIADFNRTWSILPSTYNCDSGLWIPTKPTGEENFYWNYILTGVGYCQTELVEIKEPMGSNTFYIMLYNDGRQKVYNQYLTVSYS